jgi:dimethylaniline monooxygenase (N-oxide forming)
MAQLTRATGLSGIVAAARYIQRHPNCNLTILEHDNCVGGVWSKRRDYPSFWTQWAHGVAEFGDFPMERPPEKDCMNDLFRARYTGKYLEDYVDHVQAAGRSLRDRVQFNVYVQSVEKHGDRWHLACTGSDGRSNTRTFIAARLMMANGQASIPRYPDLPGKDGFEGKITHQIDFGKSGVIQNGNIQHITVLGGGKSAADMVYESAKAGKTVSWVIRKTGDGSTGPSFFTPPDVSTPYQNPGYAAQTRIMSSLQPCFMNKDTWWTWFLHRTSYGVSMVKWIFGQADQGIRKRAAYAERDSSGGFDKLEYEDP